jgi:general secretion pathway protein G
MSRFENRRRERRGFTLMEVLLVLAILVILFSTAVGVYTGIQASSYRNSAKVQVENIDQAAQRFQASVGQWPTVIDDLNVQPAGITPLKWAGPHIEEIPADPWGNPYQYVYPGQQNAHLDKPDIWSWGPDQQSGTEDDIGNWTMAE